MRVLFRNSVSHRSQLLGVLNVPFCVSSPFILSFSVHSRSFEYLSLVTFAPLELIINPWQNAYAHF